VGQSGGSELERFRAHLRTYNNGQDAAHAELPDDVVQNAIDGAKNWIGGRRWSWLVVAANYLRDGRFHA
jgi:hypothetical protein